MLINGWDISAARAEQRRVVFGTASPDVKSEWVSGSARPILLPSRAGFKSLKVEILVKGSGREEILRNESLIQSKLLDPVDLTLDGFSHKFSGYYTKSSITETAKKRWHILALEFNVYEYGAQISASSISGSITVNNPGNIITPAILNLTPQAGVSSLTISGISRDPESGEGLTVSIRNMTANKKVVLDGESGLMMEDGSLNTDNITIWEPPSILPGVNTIKLSSAVVSAVLKFYPRYI